MKKMFVGLAAALVSLASFAGFIDERTAPAPSAAQASAASDAAAAAQAPLVDLSLHLKAGDLISERLTEWSRRNGYSMTWDAPEFRSEADLHLVTDYEKALDAFLGSMRLNTIRLEAEIFSNKAVRIQEVK